MAKKCPDCGTFLDHLGNGPDPTKLKRTLSHYWCPYDGNYLVSTGNSGLTRTAPELRKAYLEFAKYIQRDAGSIRWTTIFFQMNDATRLGVMVGTIMGVHQVSKKKSGEWAFEVSTTSCTRIPFSYDDQAVAIQDRTRLIVTLENYHASDAQD